MISGSDSGPGAAAEAGADAFLRKPFEADELIHKVDQLPSSSPLADAGARG